MKTRSEQIAAVRAAWQADPDIGDLADRLHITPNDTGASGSWLVIGDVPTIAARRKAPRLARGVLATGEVEDRVFLEPAICESDEALAREVRTTLRSEPQLEAIRVLECGSRPPTHKQPWIGVIVHSGIIHLGGWVPEFSIAALAEGVAWETCATRDVLNLIRYRPPEENRDEAIAAATTTLMREHPRLGDQPIHVEVRNCRATLSGCVSDDAKLRLAESLCWFAPQVIEIDNQLEISGELT